MLADLDDQLRALELKCRWPVEHLLAGEYHSIFKGRGIEFEDVRPYQPGDDVRTMDWKVTARTGRPHIKRFVEEREQFIFLAIDLSASISGEVSERRRKTIAELGALLTLAAIGNHDRVGVIFFTDRVEQIIPPGKGRPHALRILDALLTFVPEGRGTSLREAVHHLGRLARRRSVIFILSDFLVDNVAEDLGALGVRHDLSAIRVFEPTHPVESSGGLLRIRDAESGTTRIVDLAKAAAHAAPEKKMLRESLSARGIHLLDVRTGSDGVHALNAFFRARQQRVAGETGG